MVDELKDICRSHELKGYSGLKKEELVTLVATALQEAGDDAYAESIASLTPSQGFLLWVLAGKPNGTSPSNNIRSSFLEKFTRKTYASAQDSLLSIGFIFQKWDETKEDDVLIIPPEILPRIRKGVKDLAFDQVKTEIPEVEKVENITDLLLEVSKGELSGFCEDHDLPKSGTKEQLVERITGAELDPAEVLDLPSKPVLKWACEVLGCKVSGTKEELKTRIFEKLFPGKDLEPVNKGLAKMKHTTPEIIKEIPEPSPEEIKRKELEDLITFLKVLRPPRPKDEGDFQSYLFGRLQGQYGDKNVRQEKTSKGGQQRYDILLWSDVLVETKAAKGGKIVRDGMGQLLQYMSQNPSLRLGILAVYDLTTGRSLTSEFNEFLNDKMRILIW